MKFAGGPGCQAVGCRSGTRLEIVDADDGTDTVLMTLCAACRVVLARDEDLPTRRYRGAPTELLHVNPDGGRLLMPDTCPCCDGKGCPDGWGFGRECQHRRGQEVQAELFAQVEVA